MKEVTLASAIVVILGAAVVPAQAQQGVPDHYSALRTYIQGTVLEVSGDGMTLLIEQQDDVELFAPTDPWVRDPASPVAPFDPADLNTSGVAVVSMSRAKGWVFIDDPEGGPQRKVRLADYRYQFQPGHVIQIGAVSGLPSVASEWPAQIRSTGNQAFGPPTFDTGRRVRIEGWVYIRVSTWRLTQKEKQ